MSGILILVLLFLIAISSGDVEMILTLAGASLALVAMLIALIIKEGKKRPPLSAGMSIINMSPAQYEEHVGHVMQEQGFRNVQVMGGTGDFGADVLCTDTGGQKVCVQCKKYSKPVGVSAVQEVIGARGFYGCQRAIVATTTGFTPAARQLAEKNGVELVIIN